LRLGGVLPSSGSLRYGPSRVGQHPTGASSDGSLITSPGSCGRRSDRMLGIGKSWHRTAPAGFSQRRTQVGTLRPPSAAIGYQRRRGSWRSAMAKYTPRFRAATAPLHPGPVVVEAPAELQRGRRAGPATPRGRPRLFRDGRGDRAREPEVAGGPVAARAGRALAMSRRR